MTIDIQNPAAESVSQNRSRPTLWSNPDYLLLMTGKTTQIIGAGLAAFAVPLIAFALTGSVLMAGVISAIGEAGYLIAALPAGAIADRVDRKRLLIVCSALGAALWGSLVLAQAFGSLTGWHLAAVLFCSSLVGSFFAPAESAGIREVIRSDQLGSAMAAMQGRSAVAALVAGPIGGLLYGLGRVWPLMASMVGYLVVGVCTCFVRRPLNGDLSNLAQTSALSSMIDGVRFVWNVPFLRVGIAIFAMLNLAFGGILFSLNLHLVQTQTEPLLIGLINTAAGAAMLLGAVVAGPLVTRFRGGPLAVASVSVAVLGAVGLTFSVEYWQYLVWIAVASVMIPALNSALIGYASAITPSRLQGRMNSVLSLSSVAVAPLAPLLAGALLGTLGVNWAMGVCAALLTLGAIVFIAFTPIRSIGRPETWAESLVEWPQATGPVEPIGASERARRSPKMGESHRSY